MLIGSIIIYTVVRLGFLAVEKLDKTSSLHWVNSKWIILCSILLGVWSYYVSKQYKDLPFIFLSILSGCFFLAALMDSQTCFVYRFVWWIGIAVTVVNYLVCAVPPFESITNPVTWELVVYCILQQHLFSKLYGKADCHGFCLTAFLLYTLGRDAWFFLLHMTITFSLLLIVQLVRKNISRRGKLKTPVPLIPYIMLSFCIILS